MKPLARWIRALWWPDVAFWLASGSVTSLRGSNRAARRLLFSSPREARVRVSTINTSARVGLLEQHLGCLLGGAEMEGCRRSLLPSFGRKAIHL